MKKLTLILAVALATPLMTGCMGQMGLTKAATGVNLKAVDNRYGRAGIYILAAPVYGVTSVVDLLVLNSIEFWTGTNPITHEKPLVDAKADTWLNVNDDLGKGAQGAPLAK